MSGKCPEDVRDLTEWLLVVHLPLETLAVPLDRALWILASFRLYGFTAAALRSSIWLWLKKCFPSRFS